MVRPLFRSMCPDRWLPAWAPEHVAVVIDDQRGKIEAKKTDGKRPGLSAWVVAFDHYMLGAAALEQMPWEVGLRHKARVLDFAFSKKSPMMGVIFDELCRCGSCC